MAGTVKKRLYSLCCLILLLFLHSSAEAGILAEQKRAVWAPLIERLAADGENKDALTALFEREEVRFNPGVMPRKLTHKELPRQYDIFLTDRSISKARRYLENNKELLRQIQERFDVPAEILTAILLIETDLGNFTGRYRTFNILASMALADSIEQIAPLIPSDTLAGMDRDWLANKLAEKSQWAYNELKALLEYARRNQMDPLGIQGSIFGAIGICQFMPSNALKFGIDFNNDGRIDLFSTKDAMASMANYLSGYGWKSGLDRAAQEQVIYQYNHSTPYVKAVLGVAERLGYRP
ncbi:MAG: lytic murein transglycosylase [Deltaproteobacteria bacterium]|jgi:membrane-bound lytic murein transglycosylase B|nr:lytic murein transglycosylase [Deltaproteobacteria bacterium]